jgi:hypothetical protein
MLEQALAALAAAGGTAVVQAVGTDAWTGFRRRLVRLLGRGDGRREHAELERLDQTTAALASADAGEVQRVRMAQEASWRARFEALLESATDEDRERIASELRRLVHDQAQSAPTDHDVISGSGSHVSWPHQVGVLPRQADCFQNRGPADALGCVDAQSGTEALSQVLTGTGGVGKTQLAAHYARRMWQAGQLDLLVWVTAATRTAITEAYAQAAVEVLDADRDDPEAAAQAFLAWLEPRPHPAAARHRWLIVLDDVTEPASLRGLWPPEHPHGRTLITTRSRDAALTGPSRRLVPIGLFSTAEATGYLAAYLAAHGRHEPVQQVAALAEDLGRLPLALSQAAAYLIDADLDCATYRQRLNDRATALTDLLPDASGLPDDQATTVAAAWSLSVDRADRLNPRGLARPMLALTAMLDPNGIPATVLTNEAALTYLTGARTASRRAPGDGPTGPAVTPRDAATTRDAVTPQDAVGALRALHLLSLIDHTPATARRAVRVHQLVQRSARDVPAEQYDRLARTAADALCAAWPEAERDTAYAQTLRANADSLTEHAVAALTQADIHPLLSRAGRSLGESGQVTAAVAFFQRLADEAVRRLGADHPDTLTARHNLAHWQAEQGNLAGAMAILGRLLADRLRVLGPDHPDTLTTRHELATRQGQTGDVANATSALTQLLTDRLRVLGPDHPDTLTTRHDIIWWRWEAGDVAAAAPALAELLTDRLRVQGPDHPDTLTTRHNLGAAWADIGDAPRAFSAYTELLADRLRIQGPDHPDTLGVRHNLAACQGQSGDPAGAATAYAELLTDRLRVQGPDHPDTLTTRAALARCQGESGQAGRARATLTELLPDRQRVLGPDHPDTLTTRHNLAHWQGRAGDPAGAAAALAELLTDRLRVIGPDHPDTITTRHNLARWRGEAGTAAGTGQ